MDFLSSEGNMRNKWCYNLPTLVVSALLLTLAAVRYIEAAAAGPTVTVYQSPT